MSVVGYACISAAEQTTRQQIDVLRAAASSEICEDTISGALTHRNGLDPCLETLNISVSPQRIGGPSRPRVIAGPQLQGNR